VSDYRRATGIGREKHSEREEGVVAGEEQALQTERFVHAVECLFTA